MAEAFDTHTRSDTIIQITLQYAAKPRMYSQKIYQGFVTDHHCAGVGRGRFARDGPSTFAPRQASRSGREDEHRVRRVRRQGHLRHRQREQ